MYWIFQLLVYYFLLLLVNLVGIRIWMMMIIVILMIGLFVRLLARWRRCWVRKYIISFFVIIRFKLCLLCCCIVRLLSISWLICMMSLRSLLCWLKNTLNLLLRLLLPKYVPRIFWKLLLILLMKVWLILLNFVWFLSLVLFNLHNLIHKSSKLQSKHTQVSNSWV